MRSSRVYHVMTRPKLFAGLPLDYAMFSFAASLGGGGFFGIHYFQSAFGALLGAIPPSLVFWIIGFFMTKRDPEFFTVWIRSVFQIGDLVSFSGKRDYEP